MPCHLIDGFANGITRVPLSQARILRNHFTGAEAGDLQWDVKTLGALLQPAAALLVVDYRVVRRRRSTTVRVCGVNDVTLTFMIGNAYSIRSRTPVGGQFDWGGTPTTRYHRSPKVSSSESELRSRVQKQKLA
jgi:hypothetical protein